jgi:hypothetical protein
MSWLLENPLDDILPTITQTQDYGWQESSIALTPAPTGDGWKWRVPVYEPDLYSYDARGDDLILEKNEKDWIKRMASSSYLRHLSEAQRHATSQAKPDDEYGLKSPGKLYSIDKYLNDDFYGDFLPYFVGNVNLEEAGLALHARSMQWAQMPYNQFAMEQMLLSARRRANLFRIIEELAKTPYTIGITMDENDKPVVKFQNTLGMIATTTTPKKDFGVTDANNVFTFKDVSSIYYGGEKGEGIAIYARSAGIQNLVYMSDVKADPKDISEDMNLELGLTETVLAGVSDLEGRGIPPFRTKDGEKYLFIYGDDGGASIDWHMLEPILDKVLPVPVPSDILNAASLPAIKRTGDTAIYPLIPSYTAGISYLVGYPGVFRFLAEKNRKSGLIEWKYGFGGEKTGYAWDELVVYKSARAPKGSIAVENPTRGTNTSIISQHVQSQDVIKIVTPLALNYKLKGQ